jgi:hypothetical protein
MIEKALDMWLSINSVATVLWVVPLIATFVKIEKYELLIDNVAMTYTEALAVSYVLMCVCSLLAGINPFEVVFL